MKKITAILIIALATISFGAQLPLSNTEFSFLSNIQQGTKAYAEVHRTATTAKGFGDSHSKKKTKGLSIRELADNPNYASTCVVKDSVRNKKNCFVVISKKTLKLFVYETVGTDTLLVAKYPVCVGKNMGQKQKKGDMRTPESSFAQPFTVVSIQPASAWHHDFKDGRGSILAYGNWFIRLKTPGFSGIGIHGSTNNENSVPGRASEGCIRLRDSDLDVFKEKFAFVGMKVVILPDVQQPTK